LKNEERGVEREGVKKKKGGGHAREENWGRTFSANDEANTTAGRSDSS